MKTRIHYHNIGKPAHARSEELTHHFVEQHLEPRLSKLNPELLSSMCIWKGTTIAHTIKSNSNSNCRTAHW